ncbi:MAG: sugar phosphate isomerase/epimerase [SAR202 cluster bacterium]|nr:sugar phosphate isomerase/epimerase [SAR202 cluster bacterium]
MRFCYANRRFALYPQSVDSWNLSPEHYTDDFLEKTKNLGFDAIEVGLEVMNQLGSVDKVKDFRTRFESNGLEIGCIRSGGTLHDAMNGPHNRERLNQSIQYAEWSGAEVVNGALSAPTRHPEAYPGAGNGYPVSQDASRDSNLRVYEDLASVFQTACKRAADSGINVTVEVHQNSPVDNSWSALLLHGLVDRQNFGVNPDIGNVLWTYDVPEEDFDKAIDALAPVSKYWHCKNLHTVYHAENNRSVFIRVPLPDGEIDYRYAMSAMHNAGYSGYMTIEGAWAGDQWAQDEKSISYAKAIWSELES